MASYPIQIEPNLYITDKGSTLLDTLPLPDLKLPVERLQAIHFVFRISYLTLRKANPPQQDFICVCSQFLVSRSSLAAAFDNLQIIQW